MSNPKPDIFTSLDLEMNQPSGKIIQIGAVVGNIRTGEILETINCIVNCGEQLHPKIITLTGITQEAHDAGIPLEYAYDVLRDAHEKHKSFVNPITWGGGDSLELRQQLGLAEGKFIFGRRWLDTKTIFQTFCIANNLKVQSGLKKSCKRMGVKFDGPAHNATQDALNTFKLFRAFLHVMSSEMGQILFGKEAQKEDENV